MIENNESLRLHKFSVPLHSDNMEPRARCNSFSHINVPNVRCPGQHVQGSGNLLMMRIFKILLCITLLSLPHWSVAAIKGNDKCNTQSSDWDDVIEAIAYIESRGNAQAVNGIYAGLLQISPIMVKEVNNILRSKGSKKRYSLKDRFSAQASREMFEIIMQHHNPEGSIERAIRIWKGGANYNKRRTQGYYNRVMAYMGD